MRRILIGLTVLIAAIGLVVGIKGKPDPELVFKGRPASTWLAKMQATESKDRREATDALGWLGPTVDRSLPALIAALYDPDQLVRANAGVALGRFGGLAVPALIRQTESGPVEVRRGAALALGFIGKPAEPAIPALVQLLSDPENSVRQEAARSLAKIGPMSVGPLIDTLDGADRKARAAAIVALVDLGSQAAPAIEPLAAALRDHDHLIHGTAAEALSGIGKPAVGMLISALDDPNPDVRHIAASALSRMGVIADEAVPSLVRTLDDTESPVRAAAANALGRIGPAARAAVDSLQVRLKDTAIEVRKTCAEALGRLGRLSITAVPTLLELQQDEAEVVRKAATDALVQIVLEGETGTGSKVIFMAP
jgi:HEAT repeat protein